MLLGILVSFFIGSNRVIAVTLATLQSEGDAIYAMSQTMTYLVTVDGERSRKFVDSIALPYTMIRPHCLAADAMTSFEYISSLT